MTQDDAITRTLKLLDNLDTLMELYRMDEANELQIAQIINTLRWINDNLDQAAVCELISSHAFINGKAMIELLCNPIFVTQ